MISYLVFGCFSFLIWLYMSWGPFWVLYHDENSAVISNTNEHIVIVYEAQTCWFGGRIHVGHGFVANTAEHVSDTCLLLFIYLFSGHAYPCWSDSPAPFLTTPASFFSWCARGPTVLRQQLYAGPMLWPSTSTKQLVRRGHISLFVARETLIGSANKGPCGI